MKPLALLNCFEISAPDNLYPEWLYIMVNIEKTWVSAETDLLAYEISATLSLLKQFLDEIVSRSEYSQRKLHRRKTIPALISAGIDKLEWLC